MCGLLLHVKRVYYIAAPSRLVPKFLMFFENCWQALKMYLLRKRRVQELKQYSVGIMHYLNSKKVAFEIIVASDNICFNASPFWRLIDKM